MSIRSEISECLEELETDLQDESGATQKIIWNGLEIPCVPSSEDLSSMVADVGPQIGVQILAVIVRKSHFITADLTTITADSEVILADNDTPRLRSGKKPTAKGRTYRVINSVEDPSGAYFKVYMRGPK